MTVDAETVKRVAHLARIKVSDSDIPALQNELNAILGFVEQLNEIDVDGVEPMTSVIPANLRMRPDLVTDGNEAAQVTQNAPAQEDHYFLVPKVVE